MMPAPPVSAAASVVRCHQRSADSRSSTPTLTTTGSRSVAVLLATTGITTGLVVGSSRHSKTSATQKNPQLATGLEKSLKIFGQQGQGSSGAGSVAVLCSGATVNSTSDVESTPIVRAAGGDITDELENQVITDSNPKPTGTVYAADKTAEPTENQNLDSCELSDIGGKFVGDNFYIDDEFNSSPKRAATANDDCCVENCADNPDLEPLKKRVKIVEKLDFPDKQVNNKFPTSIQTEKKSCLESATTNIATNNTTENLPKVSTKNPPSDETSKNLPTENQNTCEHSIVEVTPLSDQVDLDKKDKTIVHKSEERQCVDIVINNKKDNCTNIDIDKEKTKNILTQSPPSTTIVYSTEIAKDLTENQKSNNTVSLPKVAELTKNFTKFTKTDNLKDFKNQEIFSTELTQNTLGPKLKEVPIEITVSELPTADTDISDTFGSIPVTFGSIPVTVDQILSDPIVTSTFSDALGTGTYYSCTDLPSTYTSSNTDIIPPAISVQASVPYTCTVPYTLTSSYPASVIISQPSNEAVVRSSTVPQFQSTFSKDFTGLVDSKQFIKDYLPLVPVTGGPCRDYLTLSDKHLSKGFSTNLDTVAVATLDSVRDPGVGVGGHAGVLTFHPGGAAVSEAGDAHGHTSLALDLIQEGLHNDSQEVRVYNGTGDVHQLLSASQIMTATTQAALESVLDCVKTEPEDLTGANTRNRSDQETVSLPLDVRVRGMGIVTSPEGESIILSRVLTNPNAEDLHVAPGFPNTTLASYDNPPFSTYTASETRIYDSPFRDEGLYDTGYRAPTGSTYYVSSSTGAPTPGLPDLPSPDSGIGQDQMTPDSFEYQSILDQNTIRRPWHESYNRANSENEKVQIPKVYSHYGFKYYLDAPTSSSVRKEDDKVTYINKGQFYGVTLEYVRDPEVTLASNTVKSVIMLVFREGKSQEEEIKAWQFWHQRQHSIKQRIIDVDTKNSHGLVGHIEELSHNAIAIYWNPLESIAKVNLAVQCLSTDFSTQKGVKGLPLHIQIDTFEDPRQEVGTPTFHRGYCQVKIFCDKGAERKLRDEERRAAKRRQPVNGKRRMDELYHETFERSDFYSMSDLNQPPTLFTPPEDPDKSSQLCQDFPSFYSRGIDQKPILSNGGDVIPTMHIPGATTLAIGTGAIISSRTSFDKGEFITSDTSSESKPKRARIVPPSSERIMIYVRQVMVTEGPSGDESMFYDITLSEMQHTLER